MAGESEFSRQDFIPDDVLMAPLILTENMEKLLAAMDKVTIKSKEISAATAGAKDSGAAVGGANAMTEQQKQLLNIQNQISKAVAKDTDAYREYENQLKKLKQTLKDKNALGEKEVLQASKLNSSITELGVALNKNRRSYAELTSEEQRQSEVGLQLLSVIQKQDAEFKELRESMGVFVDSVGSYTQSIIKADQEIKRLQSENEQLLSIQKKLDKETDAGKKAFDNLNIAIQNNIQQINIYQSELGATETATKKMDATLEKTGDGIDSLDDLTGNYVMRIKALGKAFIQLASSPFFITIAAIATTIYAANSALKAFFTTTDEGEDNLEQQSALWDTFFFALKKGWGEVGKQVFDAVESMGGAKTVVQGLLTYLIAIAPVLAPILSKIGVIFDETADGAVRITKEMQELQDKMLVNTLTAAQKELAANKLLEASKNKLVFTDQDRLKFLKQAIGLQESVSTTEIKNQTALLDLERQDLANKYKGANVLQTQFDLSEKNLQNLGEQIIASNIVGEEQQKLIGHVKQIIDLQAQYYQQQKRNTSQVSTLSLEIEKAQRDALQRSQDAEVEYSKFLFTESEKRALKTAQDEKASVDDRLKAVVNLQSARLNLITIGQEQELEALKRGYEERVRSEGINSQQEIDKRLSLDKSYYDAKQVIVGRGEQSIKEIIEATGKEITAIYDQSLDAQMDALNARYAAGLISLRKFEEERNNISTKGVTTFLDHELDTWQKVVENIKSSGGDAAGAEEQVQLIRSEIARKGATEREDIEKKERQARIDLMNGVFNAALTIDQNITTAKQMELDKRLSDLKSNYDLQTKIAGDDVKMKEKLAVEFAAKEKEINEEKARLQRRQAIYEKALAISQAIINTYVAASKQLAIPFLFASTVALGLLQVATIASTPIPEAEFGITNHKGGPLRVSEAGAELALFPGNKIALTPSKESIIDAPVGTSIIPHDKTMKMLAMAALSVPDSVTVDYQLVKQFEQLKHQLVAIVQQNGKGRYDGSKVYQQGVVAYKVMKSQEGHETIIREYAMGMKR